MDNTQTDQSNEGFKDVTWLCESHLSGNAVRMAAILHLNVITMQNFAVIHTSTSEMLGFFNLYKALLSVWRYIHFLICSPKRGDKNIEWPNSTVKEYDVTEGWKECVVQKEVTTVPGFQNDPEGNKGTNRIWRWIMSQWYTGGGQPTPKTKWLKLKLFFELGLF